MADYGEAVQVTVMSLAGQMLELAPPLCSSTGTASTIFDLKRLISEHWEHFPIQCQRLLSDSREFEDGELLREALEAPPVTVTCIFSPPYDGDIQKAMRAGDRAAIAFLIKLRDRDRDLKVSAALMIVMRKELRNLKGWPRITEALVERGYAQEEVDGALAQLLLDCQDQAKHSYREVLDVLEGTVGGRPLQRVAVGELKPGESGEAQVVLELAGVRKLAELRFQCLGGSSVEMPSLSVAIADATAPAWQFADLATLTPGQHHRCPLLPNPSAKKLQLMASWPAGGSSVAAGVELWAVAASTEAEDYWRSAP